MQTQFQNYTEPKSVVSGWKVHNRDTTQENTLLGSRWDKDILFSAHIFILSMKKILNTFGQWPLACLVVVHPVQHDLRGSVPSCGNITRHLFISVTSQAKVKDLLKWLKFYKLQTWKPNKQVKTANVKPHKWRIKYLTANTKEILKRRYQTG